MRKKFSEIGEFFRESRESHPVHWLIIVLAIAIVSGLCGSVFTIFVLGTNPLPKSDDKYDVFVTLFLIFFTILGLLGYGMYLWIRGKLESRLIERFQEEEQKIENRQNVIATRVFTSMGYNFWLLFDVEKIKENSNSTSNSTSDNPAKKVSNRLIELACDRAKSSLDFARKLPESEYKEDIYRCKNNWVYFLADAAFRAKDFDLTKPDKKDALKLTNEILAEVCKQDYPDDFFEYQESCAWALQHLSEKEDIISKKRAHDIIHKLQDDGDIPFSRRKEIKNDWADFLDN